MIEAPCCLAATAIENAFWSQKPAEFRRTLEPGKSVRLPVSIIECADKVVVVVGFQDVFGVPRHAWRHFLKCKNGGYEEDEDGELPGPCWVD